MPVHDWTRLQAGDFHHFHQAWIARIADALNRDGLPQEFMAVIEPCESRARPDAVVTRSSGFLRRTPAQPSARVVQTQEGTYYAKRKDRVIIRHGRGKVVAIIELVSPGNKDSRNALRSFVEKAADILNQGIHLVVVDLFPPTPRDPEGIHKAIWDEFGDMPFEFLPEKPLTVASYVGGDLPTAYVDTVGVGDELPAIPLFLTEDDYVPCPLEAIYMQAWAAFPAMLKELIETPAGASADA